MRSVILSIGHNLGRNFPFGPQDQGAVGNGTTEFVEAKKIVDSLVSTGLGIPNVIVKKVPEGLNLNQRVAWINRNCVDGDVAIEFHLDSGPVSATGCSTWYMAGSDYAFNEGKQFLAEYTRVTGLVSRHVRPDTENRLKRLAFVRDTRPLALLVELGFISNPGDLATIRSRGIQAVKSGIQKMLGQ